MMRQQYYWRDGRQAAVCDKCGEYYFGKKALKQHLEEVHSY